MKFPTALLALSLLPAVSGCGTPSGELTRPLPRPVPDVLVRPCDGLSWVPPVSMDMETALVEMRGFLAMCNKEKLEGGRAWPGA